MLFENDSFIPQFLTFLVILIVLWVCIKLIFSQKLNSVFNRNLFFFFLLVGSIVGIELMAIILKVNYPEDRVGMYLIPLFIGALCFGVEDLKSKIQNLKVLNPIY